ncbi:unnamed protein product [Ostreobium quekettii]|uniref:Nucleolar protein 6 n=1 Tax=Ostreobium quekettii TaxID=121088 RepID=A0A8S1IY80_9CHLO|nr:unnamed protein product [Ostreobium quekettii]|eukprot:evm.model.scf_1728.3 EVM.evm.TU.scf_1728.3   scf_1728:13703-24814(-)
MKEAKWNPHAGGGADGHATSSAWPAETEKAIDAGPAAGQKQRGQKRRLSGHAGDGKAAGAAADAAAGAGHVQGRKRPRGVGLEMDGSAMDGEGGVERALLQAQADELVASCRVNQDDMRAEMDAVLTKVKDAICAISPHTVYATDAAEYLTDLGMGAKMTLEFVPPTEVFWIGSYSLGTLTQDNLVTDLAVRMPDSCFPAASRDFLHYRYHAKRLLYLTCMQRRLQEQELMASHHYGVLRNDPRRPVLEFVPGLKLSFRGLRIRVIPITSPQCFPMRRLGPDRSSVGNGQGKGKKQEKLASSTNYNGSVLGDMLAKEHHEYLQQILGKKDGSAYLDAIILLKEWARAHRLGGPNGMSGFVWAMIVAHLVETRAVVPSMKCMSVFRAVMEFVARRPKIQQVKSPPAELHPESVAPPNPASFGSHSPCVLLGPFGWLNLAEHESQSSAVLLKGFAQRALGLVTKPVSALETFETLFMESSHPLASVDYCLAVYVPDAGEPVLDKDGPLWRSQERKVEALAQRALGKRAQVVHAIPRECKAIDPHARMPRLVSQPICLAVHVEQEHAFQLIDKGPSPEEENAAKAFRSFWGPRSERRHFPDGIVCEVMSWECRLSERHHIPDRIVQHALMRHLPSGTKVHTYSHLLDGALECPGSDLDSQIQSHRSILSSAEKLGSILQSMNGLALKILSTQPLGPIARHMSVFTPLANPLANKLVNPHLESKVPRCLDPVDVLVEMVSTGAWPLNPDAYMKTKASFGTQVAMALEASSGLRATATENGVDVLMDGFVFRLRIYTHNREEMFAAAGIRSELLRLSQHHGLVSLVSGQHQSFALSTRLSKRWIASQMMANDFCEDVIELLMVAAYTSPSCLMPPASPLAGFARFLLLLSSWPWPDRPLVVDPTNELTADDHRAARNAFDVLKQSAAAPSTCMFICTPKDRLSTITEARPRREAVGRAAALAKTALADMGRQTDAQRWLPAASGEAQPLEAGLMGVLQTRLDDYDVLIHLRREALPHPQQAVRQPSLAALQRKLKQDRAQSLGRHEDEGVATTSEGPSGGVPEERRFVIAAFPSRVVRSRKAAELRKQVLIGFDPVARYIGELEGRFGRLALFCHDPHGGRVVGVKWRAEAFLPQPMDPSCSHFLIPHGVMPAGDASADMQFVPDVMAVVEDMLALGEGLVHDVQLL